MVLQSWRRNNDDDNGRGQQGDAWSGVRPLPLRGLILPCARCMLSSLPATPSVHKAKLMSPKARRARDESNTRFAVPIPRPRVRPWYMHLCIHDHNSIVSHKSSIVALRSARLLPRLSSRYAGVSMRALLIGLRNTHGGALARRGRRLAATTSAVREAWVVADMCKTMCTHKLTPAYLPHPSSSSHESRGARTRG